MKHKTIILAALAALPMLIPANAEARDNRQVCREYTKTIRIDGRLEIGYGTACRTSDRTWEIVKLSGLERARNNVRDRIYDDLYTSGFRIVLFDRDSRNYRNNKYKSRYDNRRYSAASYYNPRYNARNYKYIKRHR